MAHSFPRPQRQADSTEQRTGRSIDRFAVADLAAVAEFATSGDLGEAPPVPITVWHVDNLDAVADRSGDDMLATAVTAMIVAFYSRPGDTIVSLGADPVLAGTAGAAGCDYRCVTTAADLADLDHVAGHVALIVLRWPPDGHHDPVGHAALTDLFAACRVLLHRDGATIVAVTDGPAAGGYQQHSHALIPAATAGGLDLIEHIVTVAEPVTGDDPHQAPGHDTPDNPQPTIHQHILMFVIGGERRD